MPEPRRLPRLNTQAIVLLAVAAMWLALALCTDTFFTLSNVQNLMRQMAIQGVIGIGAMLVILTRGIDLSVGSLVALVNVLLAMLVTHSPDRGLLASPMAVAPAIAVALLVAVLVGLVNGVMVFDLRLPPFIATLSMMGALSGGALLLSRGMTISRLPDGLKDFSSATIPTAGGMPRLFLILVAVLVAVEILLRRTVFGRYVYALGSNEEAARLTGVNTRLVTYGVYMLSGLLGGVAGCMLTARTWQGSPTAGVSYELDAITCAVLGGASLMGAEGNATGSFLGALAMATIYNGCGLIGIDSNWTKLIVSIILALTVAADQVRKRRGGE